MKNTLLIIVLLLGLVACEKDYSFPVANTTWENHEWHHTVVEFKTTEVIISVYHKDTDSLLIINKGIYTQNAAFIQIDLQEIPLRVINAKLDPYGYLLMHLGTNSKTKFFQKK
jgi:hypothetical protein